MSTYLAFKIPLVLDNVPGDPKGLYLAHLNIQVECLSYHHLTSATAERGNYQNIQGHYSCHTSPVSWMQVMRTALLSVNGENCIPKLTAKEMYKSMNELKSMVLNGCWKKIWSDAVNDF
jgi:hypothetical protein